MAIQKVVLSPSNYRTLGPTLSLLVPEIYFGMPPLPLIKGVQRANTIGLRGISGGNTSIVETTSSPASSQGGGVGSVKGIDFGRQSAGVSAARGKGSGKRRNKGVFRRNNANGAAPKAKKKARGKILGRGSNGQFKKKGAK